MSILFCDLQTGIDCSWCKCLNVSRVNSEENFHAGMGELYDRGRSHKLSKTAAIIS